mmetsp:Transcript_75953/g.219340  ORF Transcript_75953/g.219340 Transcript_75953/m.219340 type:complete len:245 (-) Transcript_75953:512-1246(-)
MRGRIVHLDLRLLLPGVELAKAEARGEAPLHRLAQQRFHVGLRVRLDGAAALDISAAPQRSPRRVFRRFHVFVAAPNVLHSATIRDGSAGEIPLLPGHAIGEVPVRRHRHAINGVVRGHHAHGALLSASPEHGEVGVREILRRYLGVEVVPVRVRRRVRPTPGALKRVRSEVLARSAGQRHSGRPALRLHPADPRPGVLGVQHRVLAGDFLAAAPAWVHEDVEVDLREEGVLLSCVIIVPGLDR